MPLPGYAPVSDPVRMVREMAPELRPGSWGYACLPDGAPLPEGTLATFREPEGLTIVAPVAALEAAGHPVLLRAAWIMLTVHSDLAASGLTAAVATALAAEGIACNVIAGALHDHLFVPEGRAAEALACLRALQQRGP